MEWNGQFQMKDEYEGYREEMYEGVYPKKKKKSVVVQFVTQQRSGIGQKRISGLKNWTGKITE